MAITSKVLVTGGAGFIGSNLAEALIANGAKVVIIDNFATGFRENLDEISGVFEFIEGDLNEVYVLSKALEGVEIVFHEASHHWGLVLVNGLFQAGKQQGVTLPPQLWQSVLFYIAGELTTREIRAHGNTAYVEYSTRFNL